MLDLQISELEIWVFGCTPGESIYRLISEMAKCRFLLLLARFDDVITGILVEPCHRVHIPILRCRNEERVERVALVSVN